MSKKKKEKSFEKTSKSNIETEIKTQREMFQLLEHTCSRSIGIWSDIFLFTVQLLLFYIPSFNQNSSKKGKNQGRQ